MKRPAQYKFEGRLLTLSEIKKHVPRLSVSAIKAHIEAGRNTKIAMLMFDPKAAARRGGRKSSARSRQTGYNSIK